MIISIFFFTFFVKTDLDNHKKTGRKWFGHSTDCYMCDNGIKETWYPWAESLEGEGAQK